MQLIRPVPMLLAIVCLVPSGGGLIAQTFPAKKSTAPASAPARTVELEHGTSTVPFELNSNKIYLDVKVNDTGPWPFVLDMGSSHSLLDLDLARQHKLSVTGIEKGVQGAGEVPSESGEVRVKTLALPGLSYRVGEMVAMPLTQIVGPAEGRAMRGTLGFDFLRQIVVEIDYARRKVTF